MTTDFEKEVYKMLYNNSIVFLKDGIERLVNKDDGEVDFIEHDLLTLTCTSFQISIELAIKALIVERTGIRNIIQENHRSLSDASIEELFKKNQLKTLDFEVQKNFIRKRKFIDDLTKDDFKTIDEFQIYRNRIVHFTYKFENGDLYDMKYDMVYYLIYIVFKILLSHKHQDEKPSEFLQYSLGGELHAKLIRYQPYIAAMKKLAAQNSLKVFNCIVCNNRTFSQDEDYCYCCNFISDVFTFIDCDYCNGKRSVIYDNLNIGNPNNFNETRGLCLNCDNDGIIYECPECGIARNIETRFHEGCSKEKGCINK
ncbi:hypothetical protein [Flavobacterium lindanitolerans]|jgi:hypothetical protein|uniref:hypothetical protein n=1 Tax=Flavobacterium lindanitolerans TaxID=428988 RepID=UPI0023F143BF|nr:hypothetical protein [Flavobacterium lindanitolerans]